MTEDIKVIAGLLIPLVMKLSDSSNQQTNRKSMLSMFRKNFGLENDHSFFRTVQSRINNVQRNECFTEYTDMPAWTYKIMQNSFINNYKTDNGLDFTFTNSLEIYLLEQMIEAIDGNNDSSFSKKKIYQALESMDDYFKVAFKMHIEGYKCEEIAKNLNLNVSSVKCRIYYTWKRIIELIKGFKAAIY